MKAKRVVAFLLVMSVLTSIVGVPVFAIGNVDMQGASSQDSKVDTIEGVAGIDGLDSANQDSINSVSDIKEEGSAELKDENIAVQEQLEEETRENIAAYNEIISESKSKISTFSTASTQNYQLAIANSDGGFTNQGSSYADFDSAKAAMKANANANAVVLDKSRVIGNQVVAMKDGIVVATADKVGKTLFEFSFPDSSVGTYINNGNDAFYYDSIGTKVKIGISGQVGVMVDINQVELIPRAQVTEQSHYGKNSNGDLYHKVASYKINKNTNRYTSSYASFTMDKAPDFMKSDTRYYSVDGSNFYTDPQLKNRAGTYYSYFKYLPFRSKTSYTAEELNAFIRSWNKSDSVLNGKGQAFINAQNDFGVNGALLLAFAAHESGYGTSAICKDKNNLFGYKASDEDPYGNADVYNSIEDCIYSQAKYVISKGYLNANTDGWKYFGSNIGNKHQGLNVKYASDPYWGEKFAGHMYRLDKYLGRKDSNKYQLAISNDITSAKKQGTSSAANYYTYSNKTNNVPVGMPVLITDSSNGWYEIQSDMGIDSAKTTPAECSTLYDYELAKAYVDASDFNVINRPQTLYIDPASEGKNNLNVSFNAQGGSSVATIKTEYNSTIASPATPTRNGYTFGGWYKEVACTNAWDFGKDIVTANTTLYAKWIPNTYNVTFNSQGGSTVAGVTVKYGNKLTSPTVPTKVGYQFGGWYKENVCTNAWDFGKDIISTNTTLYAKWIANPSFNDVPSTQWAYDYIESLANQNIIKGYEDGTFKPKNNLTRAQAAKMIVLASGMEYKGKSSGFADVPAGETDEYIAALSDAGIITGYDGNRFKPNEKVKRSQIAKMVTEAFALTEGDVKVPAFPDLTGDAETDRYINVLASNGIVEGRDNGKFEPYSPTTRAQFSKIISLAMEK